MSARTYTLSVPGFYYAFGHVSQLSQLRNDWSSTLTLVSIGVNASMALGDTPYRLPQMVQGNRPQNVFTAQHSYASAVLGVVILSVRLSFCTRVLCD